jgi:parallel beta-helix repeat protein
VFLKWTIGLLVAVLATALVALPGGAWANHVSCGDTITADTTLDSDLIDCPGDGIVVGVDGITLDLGGHTVDGSDATQPHSGVVVNDRVGVTVTNGSVYQFYIGIEVGGLSGSGSVVRDVTVGCDQATCEGVEAFGILISVFDALVTDSAIVNSPVGIASQGNSGAIEGSRFANNGVGVQIISTGNVVRNNTMTENLLGVVLLDNFSPGNLVEANLIRRGARGITVGNGFANTIRANRTDDVDVGIEITGQDAGQNIVEANHVAGSRSGIVLWDADDSRVTDNVVRRSDTGIRLGFGASRNLIARNRVLRSDTDGILLAGIGDFQSHNQVIGNVVRLSGADGIAVDSETRGTLLEQNTSSRNRDDGIDVDNADTTMTRNRTDRNGDLGIEAVEGVTDGGGNRARGNRNREQCTGVVCR